jgi:MFS family permease
MLIGFRFLEGIAGSTAVTIGGGTIADMFIQEERAKAMSLWSMGPLMGPVIGPVAGGFLTQAVGLKPIGVHRTRMADILLTRGGRKVGAGYFGSLQWVYAFVRTKSSKKKKNKIKIKNKIC